jgi:excinuclease UvrABC nuclease subunit
MDHPMAQISGILDQQIDFDPSADFEAFLRQAPAKWAVYLFADADDNPLQLLCVKNLRYSLKRRLQGETISLTKRIDYREIVRKIHWRRVDSAFEADWVYHDIARQIFPESYQGMVGFRPAWFIHVDPDAQFPRYVKTIKLTEKPGVYVGPLEDKHAAARLIELIEDAFDLCRYYNILLESPHGRACAYKEMGKCPAPCDGSISMEQYHRMIEWSAATLADASEMIHQQNDRMKQAAAELRFETAAKIKAFIDQLSQLGKGAFRHAHVLRDFAYITLQPGPKAGSAKLFLILPGLIEEIADILAEPDRPSELLRTIFTLAGEFSQSTLDTPGAERIGIVSHHLFSPKRSQGVFLPVADLADPSGKALLKAYRTVAKVEQPEEIEAEGVVKELQAM